MAILIDKIIKIHSDGKEELVQHDERDSATAPTPLRVYWGYVAKQIDILPGQSIKYVTTEVK